MRDNDLMSWYTVYNAKTDEIVACGTADMIVRQTVSYEMTLLHGAIDGNFTDGVAERTIGFLLDDAAAAQLGRARVPYESNNCTSEERYLLQAVVALSHLSSSYFIATHYRVMSVKIEEAYP